MAHVLVVEDADDIRLLLVDLLEVMGHTVTETADGLAGVREAISHPPDLIILDLMMPTASGDSALKFIRGTPQIAHLPVLVLSAHVDVEAIATRYGADAWLSKPVEMKSLRDKITELLARAQQRTAPSAASSIDSTETAPSAKPDSRDSAEKTSQ